ncbi:MAG: GGDEF domain-containing protein [Nocardioidaceae bacterium]|nr:GGDEF domain-containing protein [Nocardioidaceae bacterium]NUS51886.1 GGDEF domain-containing protein [Nocardioidaceae bacterium]
MTDPTSLDELELMLRSDAHKALAAVRTRLDVLEIDRDTVAYQRLLLVKGAAQSQLGDTEDGARVVREVKAWAEARDETELLAHSHRRLSALFRRVGDPALMLEHAVAAVDLLDADTADPVRADHLLGLADALGASGSYQESVARYREASLLADRSGRRYLQLAVLNNLAFTLYEAGLTDEAVTIGEQLRAELQRDGQVMMRHYGETIARTLMAVGRYDEAAAVLAPLCENGGADVNGEDCDGLVLALLALAEVRRMTGAFDRAQEALHRAHRLGEAYALNGRLIEILREQAELFAAQDRYREAFETFRDFHRADLELRAAERDSRAQTLNAIFEAAEARRSSDYFRELSVRDPLTGLHNRRHVDARLGELLDADPEPLTIGLVDLDHFKRINDTRSHAVGDEVLRRVAVLLQRAAERVEGGLAARIGGEEFLVLLPGVPPEAGVDVLEDLRREVSGQDWSEVTEGIPVTTSIGVAHAPGDARDYSALLKVADQNLYVAKDGGRDRVSA